ncbi:hypothetical protein A2Z22_01435 [Candidatus Woesebacteria bacterium RBG_16_34_12]|uniref:Peptidase M23 domain-containing protein n=1 Tax=Candidatus Woesebacteria bacterium RBG_16_34_12 TaxID=1802480 RepID=A0A1F7XA07_9BACT|nr:MAG: hypothetical protein A2Z22_01435 [Candidatus Woesebacteria bacterium RBG_16_34_12]
MKIFQKTFYIFAFLCVVIGILSFANNQKAEVQAQTAEEKLQKLNQEIEQYEHEIDRLKSQANTLSNQIAQYNAQIRLTTLKITEIEERVALLGSRINLLEVSLNSLTNAFSLRANQTYKMARFGKPYVFLLSSPELSQAVSSFYYLQKIQEADRDLLLRLEQAQNNYKEEKKEQEDLQAQLEIQKKALDDQKAAKARLLELTKNDEKRYQELLANARAELEAIQAIIAGKGEETEVGRVNESDRIASIISGSSACSNGGHLHFEVVKDSANQNPSNLLSNKAVEWDNAPDGPFTFSGSWQWPVFDPIRITQGYGMTYYASNLHYYGGNPHSGIDMVNDDNYTVKAVKSGTLYRGSIACGGGILRYVHVKQEDGYDTYFLHVNY